MADPGAAKPSRGQLSPVLKRCFQGFPSRLPPGGFPGASKDLPPPSPGSFFGTASLSPEAKKLSGTVGVWRYSGEDRPRKLQLSLLATLTEKYDVRVPGEWLIAGARATCGKRPRESSAQDVIKLAGWPGRGEPPV